MSSSDRLLIPACVCGKELALSAPRPLPDRDTTHIRVYHCRECGHETRITVWGTDVSEAYSPIRALSAG